MIDPAGANEWRFSRTFDAPRELVFRCMTEPDHLARFWGPAGTSAPREHIAVDARPGGVFETLMINDGDGSAYPTKAVYDEVREPELLVWTEVDSGIRVTVQFVDLDGRTEVRIHETNMPETYLTPEAKAGFLTSLDRFDIYLSELQQSNEGDWQCQEK